MPGTPSDLEESAHETNSNEQVLQSKKKFCRPAGIFLVMAFVEKLNPLNYNLTL